MEPHLARLALLGVLTLGTAGCAAVAAGTAGGVITDEAVTEDDGEFDPLENTEIGEEVYD